MKQVKTQTPVRQHGGVMEIKAISEEGRFAGYASVFDVVDNQRDVVRAGAFRETLRDRTSPVQLLWQHAWEHPIGVIEQLFEDGRGLFVQGRLLMEVEKAREAHALLKAGAIRGLSIGYQARQAQRDPETGVRALLSVELWEISLVTLPANAQANVTVVKQGEPDTMHALMHAVARAQAALR